MQPESLQVAADEEAIFLRIVGQKNSQRPHLERRPGLSIAALASASVAATQNRAVKCIVLPDAEQCFRPRFFRPSIRRIASRSPGPGRCRRTCAWWKHRPARSFRRWRKDDRRESRCRYRRPRSADVAGAESISTQHRDFAALGEFSGVAEQVQAVFAAGGPGSPIKRGGHVRLNAAAELEDPWRARERRRFRCFRKNLRQIEFDALQLDLAGLDFREIENIVDDVQKIVARAAEHAHVLALFVVERQFPTTTPPFQAAHSWACGSRDSCAREIRSWPG